LTFNNIHQADLLGPRYIKNDGRFYSFNVIDLFSHRVYVESQRTKDDRQVAASLMRCWKTVGMPDFLQLDNELSFRGSNRYPRSMGLIIRLCLYYGVTPVFIPIGEPWRNGVIESFNNTYDKKFYRRQWFPSYAALKRQSKNFQSFHNKHHRYSCLKGKTPSDVIQEAGFSPITLAPATKLPKLDHVPDGEVILIRFIRSDRKLDVFSEQFKVPRDLIYSYVKAVILTETHTLHIYQGDERILAVDYEIPDQENPG
jgi:putative transposase